MRCSWTDSVCSTRYAKETILDLYSLSGLEYDTEPKRPYFRQSISVVKLRASGRQVRDFTTLWFFLSSSVSTRFLFTRKLSTKQTDTKKGSDTSFSWLVVSTKLFNVRSPEEHRGNVRITSCVVREVPNWDTVSRVPGSTDVLDCRYTGLQNSEHLPDVSGDPKDGGGSERAEGRKECVSGEFR